MKLEQEKLDVVTNTNHKVTTFSIKASAQAMMHLSSTLYTYKIKAVIREICCNAFDAHVAAGKKDVPFEVTLPSVNNLEFQVKDFGTGMSDKDVETLYTTYFESTKTDSNDFTGALGLGSKSPFCYTDQFTIESRFNGHKSIYTAFYDEDYMPSLTKLTSFKTDEENGMTIKFSVKEGDIWQFEKYAKEVLQYFEVVPKVYGGRFGELTIPSFKESADKVFDTFTFKNSYDDGNLRVVQGNVCYTISSDSIELYEACREFIGSDKLLTDENGLRHFLSRTTLIVPLGTVAFAPNRESLSLTKKTLVKLKDIIYQALTTYVDDKKKTYSECKTTVDKVKWYEDNYYTNHFINYKFLPKTKTSLTIQNRRRNGKPFKDGTMVYFVHDGSSTKEQKFLVLNTGPLEHVILCTNKKEFRRMEKYLKHNFSTGLIVYRESFDDKFMQTLRNKFYGCDKFVKSEDIEYKVERKPRTTVKSNEFIAYARDMVGIYENIILRRTTKSFNSDVTNAKFHIKVKNGKLDSSYPINDYEFAQLFLAFESKFYSSYVLVCGPKSKKYDESKDLVNYLIKEYEDNIDMYNEQCFGGRISQSLYSNNCKLDLKDFKYLDSTDKYIDIIKQLASSKRYFEYTEMSHLNRFVDNYFSKENPKLKPAKKFDDQKKEAQDVVDSIKTKYPLMFGSNIEQMKQYVIMVDNQNGGK